MGESFIGKLIEREGCDCSDEVSPEELEDHICLAGRAEQEWKQLDDEIESLRAEVAETKKAYQEMFDSKVRVNNDLAEKDDEIERLSSEVGRLHGALREILDQWDDYGGLCKMKDIARRALGEIACSECGGSGIVGQHTQYPDQPDEAECPTCHGHGWIREEVEGE